MQEISGITKMAALLGSPVAHSLSPALHNAAFSELKIDAAYLAFDVGEMELGSVVEAFRVMGVMGWNLTMPHKTKMIDYLDHIDPVAKMVGAVNTVVNTEGQLTGYTTDGAGFVAALRRQGLDICGKKVVIVGAGGASRAIVVQAAHNCADEIVILNRTVDKAEKIAADIDAEVEASVRGSEFSQRQLAMEIENADLLVNGTSLGMGKTAALSIVEDESILPHQLTVADIVYEPRETKLLAQAKSAGCRVMPGIGMLVYQGAEAFRLWTGKDMPQAIIDRFAR